MTASQWFITSREFARYLLALLCSNSVYIMLFLRSFFHFYVSHIVWTLQHLLLSFSYLAEAKEGTLVHDFVDYAKHIVVADEQFFGTILRHTEFCHKVRLLLVVGLICHYPFAVIVGPAAFTKHNCTARNHLLLITCILAIKHQNNNFLFLEFGK